MLGPCTLYEMEVLDERAQLDAYYERYGRACQLAITGSAGGVR